MFRVIVILVIATLAITSAYSVETSSTQDILSLYKGPQANWPAPTIDEGAHYTPLGAMPKEPPYPEYNPYSKEKWELGKQLFFDRRLSKSQQIACASCHDPDLGWADGRKRAIGHNRQLHTLNSPSITNSAWLNTVFWNGRAKTLEQQIIETWQNPLEMAADLPETVTRVNSLKGYSSLFKKAFNTPVADAELISKAIATFMRKITLTNTRFDKFMQGDRTELSNDEIEGLHLFRTKARCINCHNGTLLSDNKFHHLGTSFHNVGDFLGRYSVTNKAENVGAFRTPNLRGISSTAPYMHNGFINDLDILLSIYNAGWWQNAELKDKGNDIPTATLSKHIKPLSLNQNELKKLKAFLTSLDGTPVWIKMPKEVQ